MAKIEAVPKDALQKGSSSPGITRELAFKGDGCLVLRARSGPGVTSGWHHHGDHDVYAYVVSGAVRMETKTDQGVEAVAVNPGDFLHVPAHTLHREVNPSGEESEVILFLTGTGPLVINVDDPK